MRAHCKRRIETLQPLKIRLRKLITATLGLLTLILYGGSCYAQGEVHCLPLDESRIIHEMAHESLLIPELKGKIDLLESQRDDYRRSFDELMAVEKEKHLVQLEKFDEQVKISQSYDQELKGLKKAERRARRQRNVAIGLGVILLTVAAFK
jgi:hypothetical protein